MSSKLLTTANTLPSVAEVLEYAKRHGTPPPVKNPEEAVFRVKEYLLHIDEHGGEVSLNFKLTYKSERGTPIRLSASGKCGRALAYALLYPERAGSPSSRALSVFLLGHVLHDLERGLIAKVAPLTDVEKEVRLDLGIAEVKGHIDGVLHTESGPVILDVKTTNANTFKDMVKNGPRPDYVAQVNAYMEATGIHEGYLWLYNKDTSERAIVEVAYKPEIVEEVKQRFRAALNATEDNLPAREYEAQDEIRRGKPTGRQYLPWQCKYCPFTDLCWPEFKRVIERGTVRYIKEA